MANPDETSPLNPGTDQGQPAISYQSFAPSNQASDNDPDEQNDVEEQPVPAKAPVEVLTSVSGIITILLLGEFISNADATLIMAAAARVSSEFNQLQGAGWLSTGYTLGLCAAQPIYGRVSDIYGRKPLLLASYFLLALGCVICGISHEMWVVILGRVVSGVGGAGVMAMSSIIITDIVPKREVAKWRAYVNVSMTLGRSVGGPIGGLLTDTIGWRWAFLLQAPVLALAALLVIIQLRLTLPTTKPSSGSSIKQIDFPGILTLATAITTLTLLLDQGGKAFPWSSLPTLFLTLTSLLSLLLFLYTESHSTSPIFSLTLLTRPNIPASYIIATLQIAAQVGMMFSVPLYFQVSSRVSSTTAGAHLIPAVLGNTIGGLFSGSFIKRTGRYKPPLILAGVVAALGYTFQIVRWNGHTGSVEGMYILLGGLGTGFASSAAFVSMTSFLEEGEEVVMATGGYLLCMGFAMTVGVTSTNAVLGGVFRRELLRNLPEGSEEVIERALESTEYITGLKGELYRTVVRCYIAGLKHGYALSLVCSLLASVLALTVRNHRI